jgi:hypothetical protein
VLVQREWRAGRTFIALSGSARLNGPACRGTAIGKPAIALQVRWPMLDPPNSGSLFFPRLGSSVSAAAGSLSRGSDYMRLAIARSVQAAELH